MQTFTIKQIEHLSGIKAPTLRIWEKRYGLIEPCRSQGGQRVYTNEDLRSILKVVYLYKKGVRISRIAKLKEEQVLQQLCEIKEKTDSFSAVLPVLMEASLALDDKRVERILDAMESEHGFETTTLKIIYPFLENIGRAWIAGRVLPNNEHFVSHIITRKILHATNNILPVETNGKVVILFQPDGEYHEIPLLFMNYIFKKYGWQTVYFGSNTSLDALDEYCRYKKVTHIYYHLVTLLPDKSAEDLSHILNVRFPDLIILAGGCVSTGNKISCQNTVQLNGADEIYKMLLS